MIRPSILVDESANLAKVLAISLSEPEDNVRYNSPCRTHAGLTIAKLMQPSEAVNEAADLSPVSDCSLCWQRRPTRPFPSFPAPSLHIAWRFHFLHPYEVPICTVPLSQHTWLQNHPFTFVTSAYCANCEHEGDDCVHRSRIWKSDTVPWIQ